MRTIIGTHESVYVYDGDSRRVEIKELESSVQTKDEMFVWCGAKIGARICQKRSGSTVSRNYFDQGFEDGSADYFYTRDHLRSVREVIASDGTTLSSRVGYTPWGVITESGSGALSDFAFTDNHFDRPSGLSLTHYRGYDPLLGRWLSNDPIGVRGGLNLYAYVDDDPTNFIDPTGEHPSGGGKFGGGGSSDDYGKCDRNVCPLKSASVTPSPGSPGGMDTICDYQCKDGSGCSKRYVGKVDCPGAADCGPPN